MRPLLDVLLAFPNAMPDLLVVLPRRHRQRRRRTVGQVVQRGTQQGRGRLVLAKVVPDESRGTLESDGLQDGRQSEDDETCVRVVGELEERRDDRVVVRVLASGLALLRLTHGLSFVDQVGDLLGALVSQLPRKQLVQDELFGVLEHYRHQDPHHRVVRVAALLDVVQDPLEKHLSVEQTLK